MSTVPKSRVEGSQPEAASAQSSSACGGVCCRGHTKGKLCEPPPSDFHGVHRAFEHELTLNPHLADCLFGMYEGVGLAGGMAHVDLNAELVNRASYRQLNAVANLLARLLKQHLSQLDDQSECGSDTDSSGSSQHVVVSICMNPRLERVLAVLALWKLGIAFTSLDCSIGTERVATILEAVRPVAALAMPESRGLLVDAAARLTFRLDILLLTNILPSDCFFEQDYVGTRLVPPPPVEVGLHRVASAPQPLSDIRSAFARRVSNAPNFPTIDEDPAEKGTRNVEADELDPSRPHQQRLLFVDFEKASSLSYLNSHCFEQYDENLDELELPARDDKFCAHSIIHPNERLVVAVLYKSDSTGTSVTCERLSCAELFARLEWQLESVPFSARDVALHTGSSAFIDSHVEVFTAIGSLVPLVIAPHEIASPERFEQLANIIQRFRVTRLAMEPSPWQSFCSHLLRTSCTPLASVSTVILTSEALSIDVQRLMYRVWDKCDIPVSQCSDGRDFDYEMRREVVNLWSLTSPLKVAFYVYYDFPKHGIKPVEPANATFPSWTAIEMLREEHHDEVAQLFGMAFARRINRLYLFRAAELVEFNRFMFWPHFLTSGCSFIVRDSRWRPAGSRHKTPSLVAVVLALDAEHFEEYVATHAAEMQAYLSGVRDKLRALWHVFERMDDVWKRFNKAEREKRGCAWPAPIADRPHRGHWLDIHVLGVYNKFERLALAQLSLPVELHCRQLALQHEYIGDKSIDIADSTPWVRSGFLTGSHMSTHCYRYTSVLYPYIGDFANY